MAITEGLIGGTNTVTTVSLSPPSLTNGGLVVHVCFFDNNNTITNDTCTWDGVSLTNEGVVDNDYLSNRRLSIKTWTMIAPDTDGTSKDLVVSFSEAPTDSAIIYWFLNGLHQTDFFTNLVSNVETGTGSDTPTVEITTTNSDAWCVSAAIIVGGGTGGDYWTVLGGEGLIEEVDEATGTNASADFRYTGFYREEASTGTFTLESSAPDQMDRWTIVGAELIPAAGGAADPEGPLVGGKLIGGGILVKGRLVGS